MNYRKLGNTDLEVSTICLGTMTWGEQNTQEEGFEQMDYALEKGINFFDAAEMYPSPSRKETYGETEKVIGNWLSERKSRDKIILASKISGPGMSYIRGGGLQFSEKNIAIAIENSLKRLKTDYIDLYQLHWPNPSVPIDETMNAMEFLVDVGKVKFIGVSNFSVAQMDEAQNTMKKYKIVSNQVKFSLIDRSIESEILPYCQENHITVMAYTPLARDLKNFRGKAMDKVMGMVAKSEAQVALNWCISKDNVVAIPKANSIEHVEDDCGASDWKLSTEHIRLLEEEFKQVV